MVRRAGRAVLHAAALAVSVAVGLAFAFAVVLSQGPISLAFLTPYLEEMLNDAAQPLTVRIGDATLAWRGWERQLDIQIAGLRFVDPRDGAAATIPQAAVDLSGTALLRGKLRPSRLELVGARLRLVRQADGRFSFGLGGQDAEDGRGLGDMAAAVLGGEQPAVLRQLRRLQIVDAMLILEDRRTGASLRARSVDLAFLRGRGAAAPGLVRFVLSAGAGRVALPRLYPEPLAVAALSATGRLEPARERLRLDRLHLDLADGPSLAGSGALWRRGGALGLKAEAQVAGLTVEELKQYWPSGAGANARAWVAENILAGDVTEAVLRVDMAPGDLARPALPPEAVVLDFRFQGVEARYWSPLPPITDGAGSARLTVDSFALQLEAGHVGEIRLAEGEVRIDDLGGEDHVADVRFLATAPASAALRLLDREPLHFGAKVGIDPATVSGRSTTRAHFRIPLKRSVGIDDVGYEATADLDGFAMPEIFGLYPVSDGRLTLSVDGGGFDVEGRVSLAGVPVDLAWRRSFEPAVFASRYRLSAVLDEADRRRLGLPLDPYLMGPADVSLEVQAATDGRVMATGSADLAAARLAVAELGIEKAPGEAGRADFEFRVGEEGALIVDRIELSADGLNAEANLSLGPDGRLRRLAVVRLRDGANDFAADVAAGADGGYDVRLSGHSLDLRTAVDGARSGGDSAAAGSGSTIRVTAALDRLLLTDGLHLAAMELRGSLVGGAVASLRVQGMLNGAAPLTGRLESDGEGRLLTLASSNAGAALRAAGILGRAEGGTLRLVARLPDAPGTPIRGELRMDDFRISDAPLLARMLTLASLTGIVDALSGEGMSFAFLRMPFTMTDEEIRIKDARAVGSQVGLTANGIINRRAETLDIDGTLVPAYTLNSVLGHIPVLGRLFVGRPGEGIFAISYDLRGPLEAPEVTVNPLTALAPGFLRMIVEGISDGDPAGQADGRAPILPAERPTGR